MALIEVTTSAHAQMIDITERINSILPDSLENASCLIFSTHTTAGITINENADPDVKTDILGFLDKLVPWSYGAFRHSEGNSAAHIKAALLGFSHTLPVENGRLALGTWQGVYLCEFDGPRTRRVKVFWNDSKA
jgi:secondary thiamine-phosphate synthase enzyme